MDRAAKTNHAKNAAGHERVSAFRPVHIFPQSDQCSIPITRRSTLPLNAVPPFPQTNPPTNLKPLTSFARPESLPSQKQQLPGSEYAAPTSEAVFPTLRGKQLSESETSSLYSEPIPLLPQYNP